MFNSWTRKGGEKLKGVAAMIESKLEYALASHSKDPSSAQEALDACLEKNDGCSDRRKKPAAVSLILRGC